MFLISILIANYNNESYIDQCIVSILSQTYRNFEIIFVDDHSTDDSVKVIESYASKDDRIKVYKNNNNRGVGYTKSKCIEYASGKWGCFLDPDDYIESNALEVLIDNLKIQNDNCVAIYSNHLSFTYSTNNTILTGIHQMPTRQILDSESFLFTEPGTVFPLVLFHLKLFKKKKRLYTHVKKATDQDLYLKLSELGHFIFVDTCLYHYRIHNHGISTSGNNFLKAQTWNVYLRNRHIIKKILRGDLRKKYFSFLVYSTYTLCKKWIKFYAHK